MSKVSAGLLLYRGARVLEVLIVHPGGPFWAKRDEGAWTIAKGELEAGEEPIAAAVREFAEETGWSAAGPYVALGQIRQKSGKIVHGFASPGDVDPSTLRSNPIEIEWPPRSGLRRTIPEVDRAGWFALAEARRKLNPAQGPFLDRLEAALARDSTP